MPNYKETSISGTKWQRSCRILIENSLNKTPSINYVEEEVTINNDQSISHKLVGNLSSQIDDPSLMIPMIDLETNLPTETEYPLQLAQWILYSYYWYLANKRDNPVSITEEPSGAI